MEAVFQIEDVDVDADVVAGDPVADVDAVVDHAADAANADADVEMVLDVMIHFHAFGHYSSYLVVDAKN